MVHQTQLLATIEDGELMLIFFGGVAKFDIHIFLLSYGKIVLVFEIRESSLATNFPSQECVVRDEDHVVGIHSTERSQPITHDGKERH